MRGILAIGRREILSFFVSPVAYFVITGFLLIGGYFFFVLLSQFNMYLFRYSQMPALMGGQMPNLNQWVIEAFYHTLLVVLVFLIPLLTMRTLAEEKRKGTFELLITSPLSVGEIVFGKFLGVAFVVCTMLSLVFFFPLLLCVVASPENPPVWSGFFGVLLCGLAFSSIGMAVSSFTENQIVAGVSGMVTLLLLYVIHSPAEGMDGYWGDVFRYLSPVMQVKDMIRGVISTSALVYFASLIALGLFLSLRALEAHRLR